MNEYIHICYTHTHVCVYIMVLSISSFTWKCLRLGLRPLPQIYISCADLHDCQRRKHLIPRQTREETVWHRPVMHTPMVRGGFERGLGSMFKHKFKSNENKSIDCNRCNTCLYILRFLCLDVYVCLCNPKMETFSFLYGSFNRLAFKLFFQMYYLLSTLFSMNRTLGFR